MGIVAPSGVSSLGVRRGYKGGTKGSQRGYKGFTKGLQRGYKGFTQGVQRVYKGFTQGVTGSHICWADRHCWISQRIVNMSL